MIDGDSPQLGLLIQTFSGDIPGIRNVMLFDNKDGTIGIPTLKYSKLGSPLLQLQKRYGIKLLDRELVSRGALKFLFSIGENNELDIFDFMGIYGGMLPRRKRKPIYFPVTNIESIQEESKLNDLTRKTLIFLLTKLALKGRLC